MLSLRGYELVLVIKPSADDATVSELLERSKKFVTDRGGQISHEERWGLRRLAYPIQGFREGTYIVTHLEMDAQQALELESSFKLQDDLLRHLLVRREAQKQVAKTDQ